LEMAGRALGAEVSGRRRAGMVFGVDGGREALPRQGLAACPGSVI
jgi:hypothetical protein